MYRVTKERHQNPFREAATFAGTLCLGIFLCIYLGSFISVQKHMIDYLAQGVFSALLAVPTGAAWRSLQRAWLGER